jgi:hypothetical protein
MPSVVDSSFQVEARSFGDEDDAAAARAIRPLPMAAARVIISGLNLRNWSLACGLARHDRFLIDARPSPHPFERPSHAVVAPRRRTREGLVALMHHPEK